MNPVARAPGREARAPIGFVPMDTYARLAELPLRIDAQDYEPHTRDTSSGFVRTTTEVVLTGGGHEGRGEDVWTETEDHGHYAAGLIPSLAGDWTLGTLSDRLDRGDLFPDPGHPNGPLFRRWGVESAALDLALRQAGLSLAGALGRTPHPIRFVQSVRLGDPSDPSVLARRLERYPGSSFKLDPVADWDDELVARVAAMGPDVVSVLDFKSLYHGTIVDTEPDPALYRRCLRAFPRALIEDPELTGPAGAEVLPAIDRVTWDAPLHSVDDLLALAHPPRVVNVKPCRFGSLRALTAFYDHCEAHGIAMYGGGFFELGVGRGQIQYLASLFHADGPNDVAPGGYNDPEPPDGLPLSPLPPPDAAAIGFRYAA